MLFSQHGSANQAHRTLATVWSDEARLREIEERVNTLTAQLWGLTGAEVAGLRKSLKVLS